MDTPILLHTPEARVGDPRRPNLFAGRALGERDFERLQAYVDDRVQPLLAALGPGIVQGLDLRADGSGSDLRLAVQPGLGVAGNGTLVRLDQALSQTWPDLAAQAALDADAPLADGFYLVTLRSGVMTIDDASPDEAATRTEPDPLREAYLETVAVLGLQPAPASPRWLDWPRQRAANRLLARFAQQSPYAADGQTVSLALAKVLGGLPEWIDPLAGRWLAGPDSGARALREHTLQVLRDWQADTTRPIPPKQALPLNQLLGIDHLPAATPLPADLLPAPQAPRPVLGFLPADLQVDLVPVPASAVSGVMASELGRGTVDLQPGARGRLRLMLAVADLDHRPDLLDLPQRDLALEDRLFRLGRAARLAYSDWLVQWQRLYRGVSGTPLTAELAPPGDIKAPPEPDAFRDTLWRKRRARLPAQPDGGTPDLPEPYASHLLQPYPGPVGHQATPIGEFTDPSLLAQLEAERAAIRVLEGVLEESFKLLNEVNDYLGLQRQQFDALSASFSALAGGAPGDGSGAQTLRWVGQLKFGATTAG